MQISSLAKNIGMDVNELNNEFAINTQSMTVEQAKAQQQADTKVLQGGVEMNVEKDSEPYFQSAMYKAPQENFADFYKQVFEKDADIKAGKSKVKKSYFDFTNDNVSVRIPHDTVVHDENKHKLSSDEWQNILDNLDRPVDAVLSNKPRYNGQPVLLKIADSNNDIFGVVIETFDKKQPIITTAFKDTEANIDKWLNKNRAAQAKNTSSVTTKGMLLSQSPNSIITYLQEKFKPVSNQSGITNPNIYYQSAYHGTPHRFDEFSLDNIGTGEGAQAHGWGLYFAENKEISENYREQLSVKPYPDKIIVNNDIFEKDANNLVYVNKTGKTLSDDFRIAAGLIDGWGNSKMAQLHCKEVIEKFSNDKQISDIDKKETVNQFKKILNILKTNTIKSINGQLYKVDIPETDVLLDEDKPLNEQPEKVQKAIDEICDKLDWNEITTIDETGREFYRRLSEYFGEPGYFENMQEASEFLNQHGVKGITYDGRSDGRCYVIFDDKAIKVLETYYQSQNGKPVLMMLAGLLISVLILTEQQKII